MREAFQRIATEFGTAKGEPLSGHPLARYIREPAGNRMEILEVFLRSYG